MDTFEKQVAVIRLMELDRVYEFMTENGWDNLFDAKEDDWILKRMQRNGCLTREGVKNKFNELATTLGIPKRL